MSSDQSKIDESKAQSEPAQAEPVVEASVDDSTDETSVEQQLVEAQETIKDYWDQILRLRADIDNNLKRAQRDVENAHKYALKNFADSLLPIIDSMELGKAAASGENVTLESIQEGLGMTMNMFFQAIEKQGLEQVDPLGEKFDPERHQAISMVEAVDTESNTVIEVMQKGFTLNERLIRPAMVVVAK